MKLGVLVSEENMNRQTHIQDTCVISVYVVSFKFERSSSCISSCGLLHVCLELFLSLQSSF